MILIKKRVNPLPLIAGIILLLIAAGLVFWLVSYFNMIPRPYYSAQDFGIETVKSGVDLNQNGNDDLTDILLGARLDAQNKPKYDGAYFAGGYPPDNIGVCTDVVWRALKNAGYNLKEMVDKDITARPEAYTRISQPDPNIDFRRVCNLRVFFEKYAISLTTDTSDIKEWQPGDIVIFREDDHIGIVSDRRNPEGRTYIIHNGGQPIREEDYLKRDTVTAHFRFKHDSIPKEILTAWE